MESLIIFSNAKLFSENLLIVQFENRLQSYYYLIVEIAPFSQRAKRPGLTKKGFANLFSEFRKKGQKVAPPPPPPPPPPPRCKVF
jgi:hypothetical protein